MKRINCILWLAAICLAVMSVPAGARAGDYYVQRTVGNDANPGTGWGSGQALRTVQKAVDLAVASGGSDTIHVAAGVYSEHVVIENGDAIILLGGYPAAGGTARDPLTNVTAVDGGNTGVPVYIHTSTNITLDGFLIQHGVHSNPGGGIEVDGAETIVIRNNVISNNSTVEGWAWGAGIGVINSSLEVNILNNTIEWNLADVSSVGGGISYWSNCTGTIKGNIIRNNTATGDGGGISLDSGSVVTISNNHIYENSAANGAGVKITYSDGVVVDHNLIEKNSAQADGGGILFMSSSQGRFLSNRILSNTAGLWGGGICILYDAHTDAIVNNVIAGNQAQGYGGGISLYGDSTATLFNDTVVKNTSVSDGGGVYVDSGTTASITNCIFQGNKETQITVGDGGTATVNYSDVVPAWAGAGGNNISAGAKFVKADDYHLSAGSPCIDKGTSVGAPTKDLDSKSRPYGSRVDMGAYEWRPLPDLAGVWKSLSLSRDLKKVTVSFMVRNLTKGPADPFVVSFYLSKDGKKLPSAPFKTVSLKSGLAGRGTKLINFIYAFRGSVSGKYLVAVVDPKKQVGETNERNNTSVKRIPTR